MYAAQFIPHAMPTLEPVCKRIFSNQPSLLKCLLGGLLMLVPVGNFLAFGFLVGSDSDSCEGRLDLCDIERGSHGLVVGLEALEGGGEVMIMSLLLGLGLWSSG